jgi:hypothetical protein
VAHVNRLIRDCADDQHVFYAEIGDVLLASDGLLSAGISPDRLHLTARGHALLGARLEPELDRLLSVEHQDQIARLGVLCEALRKGRWRGSLPSAAMRHIRPAIAAYW